MAAIDEYRVLYNGCLIKCRSFPHWYKNCYLYISASNYNNLSLSSSPKLCLTIFYKLTLTCWFYRSVIPYVFFFAYWFLLLSCIMSQLVMAGKWLLTHTTQDCITSHHTGWDTLCRCPLSSLFWCARQRRSAWFFVNITSKLRCLVSKICCLANQNKPDNRQRHRVSQRV